MRAVILIPTYNERGNMLPLFRKIRKVLPKLPRFEVSLLVVDDNSEDKTALVVEEESRRHKNIYLLLRKRRAGLGAAYLAGLTYAFGDLGAKVVVVMDADLSHDPKYIPIFLKKIESGADIVIGSRYIKGGLIAEGWAPHRKFLSVFGNKLVSIILGDEIRDWTSGFRAIRKEVFEAVSEKITNTKGLRGYTFNVALAYFAKERDFKIFEVPIKFEDRRAGASKLGLEYLFHTPIFIFKTRLRKLFSGIVET